MASEKKTNIGIHLKLFSL